MKDVIGKTIWHVAEAVLFLLLAAAVTGIWTCLWLPPF